MNAPLTRSASASMSQVALFAALVAVLGLIPKIDLPFGVPITAQTLGVMLAGCLLGPWRGFQALLIFLIAVAAGLPLLSGGRGGLAPFTSPSAGYLIAWPLSAAITGMVMQMLAQSSPKRSAISAFVASVAGGIVFMHAAGIVGLVLLAGMEPGAALMADLIFVPGDLVKAALCALIVHTVARALPDWPMPGRRA